MRHTHDILRERLHKRAGLSEPAKVKFNLLALEVSEWSPNFEKLMRNRLIMGALRYGKLHAPRKPQYDRIESAMKRLRRYATEGNTELLVDVANLCLLEFEEGNHPAKHFRGTDEGGEHCKRISLRGFDSDDPMPKVNGKVIGQIFNGTKPYQEHDLKVAGVKWRKQFRKTPQYKKSERALARVVNAVFSTKNPCKPTSRS